MDRKEETINGETFGVCGPELPIPECNINGRTVDPAMFYARRTEARLIEFMRGFGSGE